MNNTKHTKRIVSKFNELEEFQYSILESCYRIIRGNSEESLEFQYFDKLRYFGYRPCITNYGGLADLELMKILGKR